MLTIISIMHYADYAYINWKFREEVHEEEWSNWQLVGITDRGINLFQFFSFTSYIFILL